MIQSPLFHLGSNYEGFIRQSELTISLYSALVISWKSNRPDIFGRYWYYDMVL